MKGQILFNLLFWIHNSFCTFHDYAKGGTPILASPDGPSLIFYHSHFLTTFLLWKTALPWNFSLCLNIFYLAGLLSNLWLALKNRVCPEFTVKNRVCPEFTVLNIYIFNHSEFSTTCAEIFHCIEIFFIFQDFWATWACPENRVCPEFFKPGGWPPPSYATGECHCQLSTRHEVLHTKIFDLIRKLCLSGKQLVWQAEPFRGKTTTSILEVK